ncbi:3-ketoacyl-CoA synthase 6-like [Beta vulgaris subsp. vulgaris]|uniref:3-ketoacyl-CoA synthase 6-like n=1 Tax=Beta vulgaris subsp. vulgaris TaxID=3555 RepID=UPI002037567E|nr:3-ketoacyl-CoA synthase 6-like [Beta vulgaris subsp. vulgaris]
MEVRFVLYELYLKSYFKLGNIFYLTILLTLFVLILFKSKKRQPIYLLDYTCFKPPPTLRVPFSTFIEHARLVFKDHPKVAHFQMRILERAGLGDECGLPKAMQLIPPQPTLDLARDEAHLVIFSTIDELFEKTGLRPNDIDIIVTNCSVFCPSPSLSSMIVSKYKMKNCIKTFNLSGMGCSASAISIDLVSNLFQIWPNSYALIVSTEIITPNCYMGSDRSMTVPACLFRLGCSSILLTNKWAEKHRAKYQLLHIVRTNNGPDNKAHKCVTQQEDFEGKLGISLSKDLMVVAGETLRSNITILGPLVLPILEKVRYTFNFIAQNIFGPNKIRPYVPCFNKVFDHICIHAGGRAVIDEIQKRLSLSAQQVEASRMSLHRFGNTSSSSIWYVLSYIEAKGRMKKGYHVWQIAFGSGFKCNSMVWKCNRNVDTNIDGHGPWKDCIHRYPIQIPDVLKL